MVSDTEETIELMEQPAIMMYPSLPKDQVMFLHSELPLLTSCGRAVNGLEWAIDIVVGAH